MTMIHTTAKGVALILVALSSLMGPSLAFQIGPRSLRNVHPMARSQGGASLTNDMARWNRADDIMGECAQEREETLEIKHDWAKRHQVETEEVEHARNLELAKSQEATQELLSTRGVSSLHSDDADGWMEPQPHGGGAF